MLPSSEDSLLYNLHVHAELPWWQLSVKHEMMIGKVVVLWFVRVLFYGKLKYCFIN